MTYLLFGRNCSGLFDYGCGFRTLCVFDESLGCRGGLGSLLCDYIEVSLKLVAAVKNCCFRAFHAADLYLADRVVDSGERCVTKSVFVRSNCRNDSAGGGQFLLILACVLNADYAFKTVPCAAACFTSDEDYGSVRSADIFPVGNFALCKL